MTFRDLAVGNLLLTNLTFAYQSFNSILDTQTIWLVGSSIIKHAFLEAVLRPGGTNLTLERKHISLWWQGYSGLQLSKTRQKIRTIEKVGPVPNFILIHCGGNDYGKLSIRKIRVVAKQLVLFIRNRFQNIRIIWSFILPRLQWRYSANLKAMENARKRLNSCIASIVLQSGGAIIRHTDIKPVPALFLQDGVHMSSLGNNIFLNSLQGGLEAIVVHGQSCFPN
ncbi:uncharacterized protein LOC133175766 [Saccostrea echinata]|uniref:uncharacterized protein LOC133175766 n=1 Tax=Saccostrea echinata TaxID=191078 RepID=UPI002A81F2E7|nr:uncharacterized protein LOC133175766 [Saccostrea echinata]